MDTKDFQMDTTKNKFELVLKTGPLMIKSEQRLKTDAAPNEIYLEWNDLNMKVISKDKTIEKMILSNVSGSVKSGECLAIIGASGAGKTTLLNYLSRKIESKTLEVTGEVLLNKTQIDNDKFALISSYVMQDDILEETMTPLEIIMFTAKLKLNLPTKEIEYRVKKMINDLNLNKCQNTAVGGKLIRGISGGERKRTSIAVELITDPKIIFLDEPTTGLDSYNAFEVINMLKNLSKKGKLVLFTIHQPCSEIFDKLDSLFILGSGKTIYFGPKERAAECFKYYGLEMPLNYNPFEHFMEVTNIEAVKNPLVLKVYPELESEENIDKRYNTFMTVLNKKFEERRRDFNKENSDLRVSSNTQTHFNVEEYGSNFFGQFGMIFGKNMIIAVRNKKNLFLNFFQTMFTGFLLIVLYTKLSKDLSGVRDRLGIILIFMRTSILNPIINSVLTCKRFHNFSF